MCANDDLNLNCTKPLFDMPLPPLSHTHEFAIELGVNASNVSLWKFDNVSFRGDHHSPPLPLAKMGNLSFPDAWNVENAGTNSSVRIIVDNMTPAPQLMHRHGFNFFECCASVMARWMGWMGRRWLI
jgi:multicopper oxidase